MLTSLLLLFCGDTPQYCGSRPRRPVQRRRSRLVSILLIGLNHRTAPVEIREQLAFSREGVATALMLFRNRFRGAEAAIISTCNRVEILVASESEKPTVNDVVSFIAQAR